MMSDDAIKKLLEQQQRFVEESLKQQQKWMEGLVTGRGTVPTFHGFNKETQNWESYLEQLEQHFTAYSVSTEIKKKSFFVSWCGYEIFELLKNLFGSSDLQQQSFKQLTEKLTEHFKSKRHVVAARYDFFKSEMKPNQSYRDWVADMKGLARECEFTCSKENCNQEFVNEMIRDQIILKTPHDSVRTAALQKLKPALEDILIIAETYESTLKTMNIIKDNCSDKQVPINMLNQQKNRFVKNYNSNNNYKNKSCSGCGNSHVREKCKFLKSICHKCGKIGHIAAVCLTKQAKNKYNTNFNNDRGEINKSKIKNYTKKKKKIKGNSEYVATIFKITGLINQTNDKNLITVQVLNEIISFQMDSGATASIINKKTYKMLNKPKLNICSRTLYAFGQKEIPVIGELHVTAKCGEKEKDIVLVVVDLENSNNLFGMDLFQKFGYGIREICNITEKENNEINNICKKFNDIFEPGMGTIKNFKASISLKVNAIPKFFRSRQIPYALLPKFKAEAERLSEAGIWQQIKFSNWASPIVLAPKPNGNIRICGDFKQAVNCQINIEQYPLPAREEILHTIGKGKYFSKIDLKDAYLQMELDEQSKTVMVVNTPLGLFQYLRLPYGIASAPAIFQRYLQQILTGIDGCANYLDDIIISAPTVWEHNERLEKILQLLHANGIKCKKEKCEFLKTEMQFLGRKISGKGILPDEAGVEAVKKLRQPRNEKEIEAFMGKVNYYHNFIPNFSQVAAPLNMLRRKDVKFTWGSEQQKAFENLKKHIIEATQLAFFQDDLPIILATDASSYGIGAVISHKNPDGSEKPIAFASKTLDKHQVKYSQIEKEALSIIFGVQRFHQYIYGKRFTLITDHKPLVSIFNPAKHLPVMTSHRLQRWAIILMAYQIEIVYRKTSEHGNADALSRLPLETEIKIEGDENCCNVVEIKTPINSQIILEHSKKDEMLKQIYMFINKGWPERVDRQSELFPYFIKRFALTIHNKIICLENGSIRAIIPQSLRKEILQLLHEGHWGAVKMKQLARQHVWWSGLDKNIEQLVMKCEICKVANPAPAKEFQSWPEEKQPWERIHIDFAGPVFNAMWLIVVDAFSKFPFIIQLTGTTTKHTTDALKSLFALEGIPRTIVSDNGPQLTSDAFQQFCNQLGIKHVTTAPFHPPSNGLAERFVRTFKTTVRKNLDEGWGLKDAVTQFLLTYRALPNTDGKSAAELLHGRPWRTILSQVFEKSIKKSPKPSSKFQSGQVVYIQNFSRGKKWQIATIHKILGKMMYIVKNNTGFHRRHQNQIKRSYNQTNLKTEASGNVPMCIELSNDNKSVSKQQESFCQTEEFQTPQQETEEEVNQPASPVVRKSSRIRKPVKRLNF